jgi:hypothetical protein
MSARWRKASLKRNFGLTPQEFDAMLISQDGVCACCGCESPGGKHDQWHVDHCHATGRVRGLLCFRCNVGIGVYEKFAGLFDAYLSK